MDRARMETRKGTATTPWDPVGGASSVGSQSRVPAVLEQVTQCGFCGVRVSSDHEAMRTHILGCGKHPASQLVAALRDIRRLAHITEDDFVLYGPGYMLRALQNIESIVESLLS
jgi:hypothetical protein